MASNLERWMKYAKARLDAAVRRGNDELDRKEAERDAELADRPWLRPDDATPTLDEVRARIEHMERGAARPEPDADPGRAASEDGTPTRDAASDEAEAGGPPAGPTPGATAGPEPDPEGAATPAGGRDDAPDEPPTTGARTPAAGATELVDPATRAADAELAAARLEIENNQREAAARLEAMRRELELDDPPPAGG